MDYVVDPRVDAYIDALPEWQQAICQEVRELVHAADPAAIASVLGSLGSPARLALLTTLVAGPRSRPELQDALGESSTGQLYHHLRDLQAAGLIHQPKRGRYEIAAHTVVPLLTILAAAGDVGVLEP